MNLGRRNYELAGDADPGAPDMDDDFDASNMDDDFDASDMDEDDDDPEESASSIANDDATSLVDNSVSDDPHSYNSAGDVMTSEEAIEHFQMIGDKRCQCCYIARESWWNRVLHQRDHHGINDETRQSHQKDETCCAECDIDSHPLYSLQKHYKTVHGFEVPGGGRAARPLFKKNRRSQQR